MEAKIRASKGLEDILEHTKSVVKNALKERRELKLDMPDDFNLNIHFYNSKDYGNIWGKSIRINVLNFLENQSDVECIKYYFDKCREFIPYIAESTILELIQFPEQTLNIFEEKKSFDEKELNKRGTPYEEYKSFFLKHSSEVKEALEQEKKNITECFKSSNKAIKTIRHEIDHCAYHKKLDYKANKAAYKQLNRAYKNKNLELLAKASRRYLNIFSKCRAGSEQRARFFSRISPENWLKHNLNLVKLFVYQDYVQIYVRLNLLKNIVWATALEHYKTYDLNPETVDYIIYETLKNTIYRTLKPDLSKVKQDVAKRILEQAIPEELKRFAKVALPINGEVALYFSEAVKNLPGYRAKSYKTK